MSIARSHVNLPLIAGLAAGLISAGCESRNEAQANLNRAHAQVQGLTPPREAEAKAASEYQKVLQTAGAVRGTDTQNAAAALLTAQAKAAIGEPAALEAARQEAANLHDYTLLRTALTNFLTFSAQADVAAAYTPTQELEDLAWQDREKEQQLAAAQQAKSRLDAQIGGLRQQAQAKMAQSRQLRNASAEMKGRMTNVSAVEGEALVRQARDQARQADALEVEAANLEAQAARQAPSAVEMQLDIDRLSTQRQLLAAARASVEKRAADTRGLAEKYRGEASKFAGEVRDIVRRVEERRADELARSADEAAARYREAVQAATTAARALKGNGQMSLGSYQQSLGDLFWSRAQGLQTFAANMDALAAARPALPESGAYGTAAERARAEAKEALDAATEAYQAASQAYQAAGGGADVQAKIAALHELLRNATRKTSGGSVDLGAMEAPAAPEPAAPAAVALAAVASDDSTPQGALAALKAAEEAGDYQAMSDLMYFASDDNGRAMKRFIDDLSPSMQRLERAMKARFGKDAMASLQSAGGQGNLLSADYGDLDPASLQFDIQGDTARATRPDGEALVMKQVGGRWKVDPVGSMPPQAAQAIPMMAMMAGPMKTAIDEVAAEVESGKHASPQAVMQALTQKISRGMGMPPGGR
jgi:hypothetical protein